MTLVNLGVLLRQRRHTQNNTTLKITVDITVFGGA